ncbi:MAG: cobalamin-dependent protein [Candidatus Micrarchaeota archaeon]
MEEKNKVRVALIRPNLLAWPGDYKKAAESIGIQLLASALLKRGCEVLIIDSALEGFDNLRSNDGWIKEYGLRDEEIVQRLKEFKPDLVGISSVATCQFPSLIKTAKLLKENFPQTPIVAGGAGADGLPELTLRAAKGAINAVCIHEGMNWLVKVVQAIESKEDLRQTLANTIGSAFLNKDGQVVQVVGLTSKGLVEEQMLTEELNEGVSLREQQLKRRGILDEKIPYPLPNPEIVANYSRTAQPTYANTAPGHYFDIFLSFGCVNACTFCTTSSRMGSMKNEKGWRVYDKESIRKFLKEMRAKGFNHVIFQDDNLTRLPPQIWRRIIEIAYEEGFTHQNNGGLEPESLKAGDIKFMAEHGCTCIYLPLNPRHGGAHFTEETASHEARLLAEAKEKGMYVYSACILGVPGQALEQMAYDILYARALRETGLSDNHIVYGYSCLPDAADFERFAIPSGCAYKVKFNVIDFSSYSNNMPQCSTKDFSFEDYAALWHFSISFINGEEDAKVYFGEGTGVRKDQKEGEGTKAKPDLEGFFKYLKEITPEKIQEVLEQVQQHKQNNEFRNWYGARQNRPPQDVITDGDKYKLETLKRIVRLKAQTNVREVRMPPRPCWQKKVIAC